MWSGWAHRELTWSVPAVPGPRCIGRCRSMHSSRVSAQPTLARCSARSATRSWCSRRRVWMPSTIRSSGDIVGAGPERGNAMTPLALPGRATDGWSPDWRRTTPYSERSVIPLSCIVSMDPPSLMMSFSSDRSTWVESEDREHPSARRCRSRSRPPQPQRRTCRPRRMGHVVGRIRTSRRRRLGDC